MEVVVAASKNVHSLTGDTGYVHAIYAGEVHLTEGLTVHFWTGNDNAAGNKVLNLILLAVPFCINLRADECLDCFCISLSTNYEEFVAYLKGCLTVWDAHLALVQET